jgi:trehalose synthase
MAAADYGRAGHGRAVTVAGMSRLEHVAIAALPIERFAEVLDPPAYAAWLALGERARRLLADRVVWCVNSTAQGGGVAEMLHSLLAYTCGAGVDSRWSVMRADAEFVAITKRLHNRLHGAVGDGGPLGAAEREHYEAVTGEAAEELASLLRPGDVVILHDPQTVGMAARVRAAGAHVVWRLHVGADRSDAAVREARAFLLPYVRAAETCVFSRRRFIWPRLEPAGSAVVAPSIDVFAAKNQVLDEPTVTAILQVAGIVAGGRRTAARFRREDGTPAMVRRPAALVQDRPLQAGERYVTQVSRWDGLKDAVGVIAGFAAANERWGDAHLLLAGPGLAAVADDPESAAVLAAVTDTRAALPTALRARVHLATLPMDDAEENAAMVNAIQRRAAVVVQKSLAEGFGLTVTEAMWKGRPLVASRVGGIQDQIIDGVDGLTVDPHDVAGFGAAVGRLLGDRELAHRLGEAAGRRRGPTSSSRAIWRSGSKSSPA